MFKKVIVSTANVTEAFFIPNIIPEKKIKPFVLGITLGIPVLVIEYWLVGLKQPMIVNWSWKEPP